MKEKDIEKGDFRNKKDMANEIAEEIKCQEFLINDDTKSPNEMEFLIDKVCVKIIFFHLMFDHSRSISYNSNNFLFILYYFLNVVRSSEVTNHCKQIHK